ncbi:MAG: rhodanese-like domain-containing protein [Betaproteobacteria bacterium]|nr:rhodanese-like domain-containing protein [Betaproteobacteria bacterium]
MKFASGVTVCGLLVSVLPSPAFGQTPIINDQIDYAGFRKIVAEVETVRESRRLTEEKFAQALAEPGVVLLDARSASMFALRHIKGAVNLPFTDFTAESLARVIPTKTTKVLIYCNNNFTGDSPAFRVKAITASLNLSTYTSLRSYGYTNVHELGPAVDVARTALVFEGADVTPPPRPVDR